MSASAAAGAVALGLEGKERKKNGGRNDADKAVSSYSEPAFEPAAGGEVVVVVGAFHASFPSEPFPSAGVDRPPAPAPAAGVPERLPIGAGTVPDEPKRADDAGPAPAPAAVVVVAVVLVVGGGAGEVPLW